MSLTKTSIEYLNFTWNPIAMRCTPVSEGCANCWHLRFADRLAANPKISAVERKAYAGGEPLLVDERLATPLKRRKSSIIGTEFMGDLFHKDVPMKNIRLVFDIMQQCPQHTFVVLTKRPERMLEFCHEYGLIPGSSGETGSGEIWKSHICTGFSAENQKRYDERIAFIKQIPAQVKFVSIEPCLGDINLNLCHECQADPSQCHEHNKLDWVIMGCESGPNARPMKHDWGFNIMDQCRQSHIPLFYKQGPDDDGVNVKMPRILGRIWNHMPEV